MDAAEPQAVLTPLTEAAIFLVLTVNSGAEDAVRELLADVSGLKRSVGFRLPEGELSCVVGLGSGLWHFSTAVTGNLFFIPTADFLDDPGTRAPEEASMGVDVSASGDCSLGIGSLKESRDESPAALECPDQRRRLVARSYDEPSAGVPPPATHTGPCVQ